MIITLQSEGKDKIEFSRIEKFEASWGKVFQSRLNVISGPFTAEIDFEFDLLSAIEVRDVLKNIFEKPRGESELSSIYDSYINFKGDGKGYVNISGKLCDNGPPFQQLEFEFSTDQTFLPPFIKDLEELLKN